MSDTQQGDNNDKNLGGRPLKFETVAALKQKIEEYFGDCDSHVATRQIFKTKADGSKYLAQEEYFTEQRPYGVEGLARALRTTRETINKYESGDYDDKDDTDPAGDKFSDAIKDAKARIKEDIERRMLAGDTPATAGIFWFKNNGGWEDKQSIDHTTAGKPIKALVEFVGNGDEPTDSQD